MRRLSTCLLLLALLLIGTLTAEAQSYVSHKVKKKETIFGIARQYGISTEQLAKANPEMESPDYQLKKGDIIMIPVVDKDGQPVNNTTPNDIRRRAIKLGVMLPLHNVNNDGRRMVEYYRGLLMACDTLRREGISVDVRAWNTPEDGNINAILQDPEAANCDIIVGPLYSKQMAALSNFVEQHDILLFIPFSITAPELYTNRNIFQVYQPVNELTENTARRCAEWFKGYHPIIIDCGDSTSTKGNFTSAFRRQLEVMDVKYSLTSLKSSGEKFARAFVLDKPNLVILNTARSPELLSVFARLKSLASANPTLRISMFGYTEWMMYLQHQQENFHRFSVYIPAPYFTNTESTLANQLQQRYLKNFHQDMMPSLPRFAFTGYDHAIFMLRGLHKYGKTFDGAAGRFGYQPVQTPLKFERIGNGGLQNRSYMFIHYKPDGTAETINY